MKTEYFTDNTYTYSIALMHAYIHLCNPRKTKLSVDDLKFNLDYTCWENNVRPIDVLTDIQNKKYTKEVARIKNADMKYPIIIDSNYNILDGFHRYAKHIIDNKKTIILVIFDKKLMKKFIIGKRNEKCNLEINDYIQLFHKRFNCAQ